MDKWTWKKDRYYWQKMNQYEKELNRNRDLIENLNQELLLCKEMLQSYIGSTQESNVYNEIDYFNFENYFRGNEEDIKNRQRVYLPYFEGCKNVLDLGCGRGEFLTLLRERGIFSKGIDICDSFVEYDKKRGLDVLNCDVIEYLRSCNESIDGIFGGQLVEHLEIKQIIELFTLAYKKLSEGGYLVLETPNPTSLAIYTQSFYVDPSHQKPIHPLTLKYIAETAGFTDVQIYFVEGSGLRESVPQLVGEGIENLEEFNRDLRRIGDYLYGAQDYAIIVKK